MRAPWCLLHRAPFEVTLNAAREAGGADLVLTSPPYDDARTYGCDVEWTFADYQRLGDAVASALKPGGHAIIIVDGPVRETRPGIGTERSLTPWRVLLDWTERVGLRAPDRLAYGRMGVPGAYAGRFRNDWEPMLWFQRPGAPGYFDKAVLAEQVPGYAGKAAAARTRDGSLERRLASGPAAEQGLRHRGTWWWYGNVGHGHGLAALEDAGHPAAFAFAFALDVVACFAPPDGLVVDPMVGAGTTALAALRLGRNAIAGDLLARPADGVPWVEVARRLLADDAPLLHSDVVLTENRRVAQVGAT